MRVRSAVRAGSWYSGYRDGLIKEIHAMYMHEVGPGRRPTTLDERMRIDDSGNVGIGITNPGEKLEVNGNIRTIP